MQSGCELQEAVVATIRRILLFLPAAMIALLAGCGGTASSGASSPSAITIAFQPTPATSIAVGFTTNFTAVVSNDPSNAGVSWSLTCQSGPGTCGTLSALHTASGAPTTYVPPSALNGNSLAGINIVALSTADNTKNVVAPLTVSAFGSSIEGTFVLQAQGVDPNLNPYQFAGVIVLDGNGNITAGEQTVNTGLVSTTDQGLTGNYFLGNDGRGIITINDPNPTIGTETFAFVYLSASQALISQMDLGAAATGASATGTMDLQTSTVTPSGGYAFVVNGTEISKTLPLAFGGVLNIDSPDTISGSGSVVDEILAKKLNASAVGLSGTLTIPDQFGAVIFSLTAGFGSQNHLVPFQFTGYIVDATHIKLIESDNTAATPGFGSTGGLAIGQGAATGSFKDNTALSGTYVYGVTGVDLSNFNLDPSTLTSAGLFTADGSGNLSNGFMDTFLLFSTAQPPHNQGAQISEPFNGTYSVDSSGTGRASVTFTLTSEPTPTYQPSFVFYLTGNGNPLLALGSGDTHYPSVGTGIAYRQSTAAPAFSGNFGFSFVQQNGSENDGTGQLNANSTSTPPSLSGIADANLGAAASLDNDFLGTFSTPSAALPFSGVLLTDPNAVNPGSVFIPQILVDYFTIDAAHGFFVETDLVTPGAEQNGQVSFGYYAARTPVCDGCP